MSTCTIWRCRTCGGRRARRRARGRPAGPQLHGLSPGRRQGWGAQLHRRADLGELFGDGGAHIAEAAERKGLLDDYPDIDGIVPITHASGCGMAGSGEGFEVLRRTLWGTAANPNFGGVLLVGLGCEVIQIGRLMKRLRPGRARDLQSFTIQESGGTRRAIEAGLERLTDMLPLVGAARRSDVAAERDHPRPAVRRLGRLVRRHLQPGARRRRPTGWSGSAGR